MNIDEREVPLAVISCWKAALDRAPDSDLVSLSQRHKDLTDGFRPGKLPPREARIRAKGALARMGALPDDFRDVLIRVGLSQSLFCALSEKALQETGEALSTFYGQHEVPAGMLLDQRAGVRSLGFRLLDAADGRSSTEAEKAEAKRKIALELRPLFEHLKELSSHSALSPPETAATHIVPTRQPRTVAVRDAIVRLRAERTTSRRLGRDLNAAVSARNQLQHLVSTLGQELAEERAETQRLKEELGELSRNLDERIRGGVQAQLDARLRPWLAPSEALRRDTEDLLSLELLDRAEKLLELQAKEDERYGLLSQLRAELDRTVVALTRVRLAMVDSLKPLPELDALAEALEVHRKALAKRIGEEEPKITEPNPTVERLRQVLATASSLDAIAAARAAVGSIVEVGLLAPDQASNAYALIHTAASKFYDVKWLDAPAGHPRPDLAGVPLYAIQAELARQRPCTLVIDGHNVLHKLPALFRADYEAGKPGPKARRALEARMLTLCVRHPNLSVQLWFDGPVAEERALAGNLRVRFSGGNGSDRADAQIAAYLQHLSTSRPEQLRAVVSADGEIAESARACGSLVLLPLELGHWIV